MKVVFAESDGPGQRAGAGGRGRRGRYRDDEEESGMTLEEWEAQQGASCNVLPSGLSHHGLGPRLLA